MVVLSLLIYVTSIDSNKWHLCKPITFASIKVYCLITLICLIILISHIVQLLLIYSSFVSVQVHTFALNMRDIVIYTARWWEKYLSKGSLVKHTCSWRDKLIVLWALNRQTKIFLRRLFDVLWNVHSIYEFPHELPNDVRIRILGN